MSTIPEYLVNSHESNWYQAMADNTEARYGKKINWTKSGPMIDGMNISIRFMYPPIFGIETFVDELNKETIALLNS